MSRSLRNSQSSPRPFTIRLTDSERADLSRRAGSMALGAYIRTILFADGNKDKARGSRRPVKDQAALAQVLSALGSSGLTANVQSLADAAAMGVLHLDDDAPTALQQACDDIVVLRLMLMQALGFRIDPADWPLSARAQFIRAAGVSPSHGDAR